MFVTNWISTTKIQKISEITNFFRHYFLSRTEVFITNKAILPLHKLIFRSISIGTAVRTVEVSKLLLAHHSMFYEPYLLLYFLYSCQLPALELHDNLMKRCALAKSLNPRSIGISPNLLHCIQPLLLRLLHRATIFLQDILQLFIKLLFRKNLEFEDVAV